MSDEKYGRREFMRQVGLYGLAGVAVAGGLVSLSACQKEDKSAPQEPGTLKKAVDAAQEAANPCTDVSNLTPDELATRTTFKYQVTSPDPQKLCKECNFFHPSTTGDLCGTCTLVKGPIHPLGSCISWTAKVKT